MRPSERPLRHRKARDLALILPAVGAMLFLPPIAQIFEIDGRIGGVPFTVVYLFAVWAALILGAAALSRRLGGPELPAEDANGDPGDAG
jgi:hypothetical protein